MTEILKDPPAKISKRRMSDQMATHLAWCVTMIQSGLKLLGPTHHENIQTHNALVRRGLMRLDAEGKTQITPEGHEAHERATK